MVRPQLILDVNHEIITDSFAGGGGASTGVELALGRHVDHAVNHDQFALGMHRINHAQTVHHCEDVFDVDPSTLAEGRRIGFGWFSPDCKFHSKAKGGKPLNKKIRGLAFVMFRWAALRTRVMVMENVEEIQNWGPLIQHPKHKAGCECGKPCARPDPAHKGRTWKALLAVLGPGIDPNHPDIPEMLEILKGTITKEQLVKGFGYHVEARELRACDYGAPTIRKRLFAVCRCDGLPIVWPEPTHANPKKPQPEGKKLKPWRPVAECIDWHLACPSIFLTKDQARKQRCKRPLAKSTLRRIATGVGRYVIHAKEPFMVSLTHHGGDRVYPVTEPINTITGAHRGETAVVNTELAPFIGDNNRPMKAANAPADEPMRTQCAGVKGGHFQLTAASLMVNTTGHSGGAALEPMKTVATGGHHNLVATSLVEYHSPRNSKDKSERVKSVDTPLPVQTTEPRFALTAASLLKLRGDPATHPSEPATDPLHTTSAGGQHHALSACYLAQHNGGFNTTPGHDAREPASTISAKGSQQQAVQASCINAYFGSEKDGQSVNAPLRSVTGKPRFCHTKAEAVIPPMTPEQIRGAHRVAKFLRKFGVKFEGEFATVGQYVIVDIGMRMLTPRELFRAQGFPDAYTINRAWLIDPKTGLLTETILTKEQQIRMCGNSVCPPVACALVAANVPDLAVWQPREKRRVHKRLAFA